MFKLGIKTPNKGIDTTLIGNTVGNRKGCPYIYLPLTANTYIRQAILHSTLYTLHSALFTAAYSFSKEIHHQAADQDVDQGERHGFLHDFSFPPLQPAGRGRHRDTLG